MIDMKYHMMMMNRYPTDFKDVKQIIYDWINYYNDEPKQTYYIKLLKSFQK